MFILVPGGHLWRQTCTGEDRPNSVVVEMAAGPQEDTPSWQQAPGRTQEHEVGGAVRSPRRDQHQSGRCSRVSWFPTPVAQSVNHTFSHQNHRGRARMGNAPPETGERAEGATTS